jgi:hypothetical protein
MAHLATEKRGDNPDVKQKVEREKAQRPDGTETRAGLRGGNNRLRPCPVSLNRQSMTKRKRADISLRRRAWAGLLFT